MDALIVRLPSLTRLDHWGSYTPDTLVTLASYLEWRGFDVGILDLYGHPEVQAASPDLTPEGKAEILARLVSDAVREEAPRLLGFTSLSSGDAWASVSAAALLKQTYPELPIVLGGYFPTCNSREILGACPAIDAVVVGEGEIPTAEILQRLGDGLPPFSESVPSLCFRQGGHVVSTPRSDPFDLNSTPPLDFGLLKNLQSYTTLVYHTSRNCLWRCSYCTESSMGTRYRAKPFEIVRQDLLRYKTLNASSRVWLSDPILSTTDRRTEQMCETLSEVGISYLFGARVDALSPALVPTLKSSGCYGIFFGLESASFDTLLRMNKLRPADFDCYQRYLYGAEELAKACGRSSVQMLVGLMLGYPGDTPEDLMLTFEFVRRMRAAYIESVPEGGSGAAFLPEWFYVDLPRESAAWRAQGFFARKGMELTGEGLFGEHRVKKASSTLDQKKVAVFAKAFGLLNWAAAHTGAQTRPEEETVSAVSQ